MTRPPGQDANGSARVTGAAIDAGSRLAKVAMSLGEAEPESRVMDSAGSGLSGFRGALAAIRRRSEAGKSVPDADIPVCVAIPDSWLDGGTAGGRWQEEFRHVAEDEFGLPVVSWAGQLASVAVLAASQRGFSAPGRYLVCDAGGTGVRVAVCEIDGRTVRQVAVHDAPGGGWQDFDRAVRAELGAGPGIDGWHESALAQDRRARLVFGRVKTAPEFRGARVYSLADGDSTHELTAGQAADCFEPTAERIRAGMETVLCGGQPVVAVLTGGLSWFPLAAAVLADAAGTQPVVLGPDAAARGALLFATGRARTDPPRLPSVSLPMHQIRNGLLEEVSVRLPWEAQFAPAGDEPIVLSGPELILDINGRHAVIPVPGLVAGEYRVGVRPSWSGSAVLVLREKRPGGDRGDADVHVVSLDVQELTR